MSITKSILSVFRPSQDKQRKTDNTIVTVPEPRSKEARSGEPESVVETHKLNESEVYNYAPNTFFELAHWSKEQNMFQVWERKLVFSIGRYLSNRWLISRKQEKHILRILEEATQKGFTPTNVPIAEKDATVSTKPTSTVSELDSLKDSEKEKGLILEPRLLSQIKPLYLQLHKTDIQVLGLPKPALNSLRRSKVRKVGELAFLKEVDILRIKNIGKVNAETIKQCLNSYIDSVMNMPEPNAVDIKVHESQEINSECKTVSGTDTSRTSYASDDYERLFSLIGQLITKFNDPSLLDFIKLPYEGIGRLTAASNEKIETLGDLRRITLQRRFDALEEPNEKHRHYIENGIKWLEWAIAFSCVDNEIEELMSCLDERELLILNRRYAGSNPSTLSKIGDNLGLTRERVRQLEKRAKKKLINKIDHVPCFYSQAASLMLTHLDERRPIESWKEKLMQNGFLKDESAISLLITMSKACEWPDPLLSEECVNYLNTGVSQQALIQRKPILQKARKICRNSGAVRSKSLIADRITEADIKKILISDNFLEIYPGWWIKEIGKYVPERVAKKVIYHCGVVSPMVMKHALGRHLLRAELRPPPSEVLINVLEQTGSISLTDGMLTLNDIDTDPPDLTGPEAVFIDLVRSEGPVLSFERIHTGLLEAGYSLGSVTALLRYSEVVHKVQVGLYSALGSKYSASDIDKAKFGINRIPPDHTIRHRTDGIVELEMNVNTWLLYAGSVVAGPGSSMRGRWTLRCRDTKGEISVGKGFIYGLGKAIRILRLSLGDRIRINFNTFTQEATIIKVVNNEESASSK